VIGVAPLVSHHVPLVDFSEVFQSFQVLTNLLIGLVSGEMPGVTTNISRRN
jgi:hypothetical protein